MRFKVKLSIIVPLLNEADTIDSLLLQFLDLHGNFEVIFADGGSSDSTLEKIPLNFTVVSCPKSRAKQMNIGSQHCQGDVLLFLHCDSILPKDFINQIETAISCGYEFGCFKVKFCSDKLFMRCCEFFSDMRVIFRKIAFGDQGIFMTKRLFDELGGFPDLPIMEDYKLSIMLKGKYPLFRAKSAIITSARRFEADGVLSTMWKMQKLQYMFRHGADINKIAKLYKDIR